MKRNKGFTLVELLVVIAIIGILSSVVFASLNSARAKARTASVQSTLRSIMPELQTCADDAGYGYTTGAPSAGTTFVCQKYSSNNTVLGGHSITWPKLPAAGSWAYSTPVGTSAQNGLSGSSDYKYEAIGEGHTVTCTFSDGACIAI
jgi:prepilin-type N-terminal cleavage/methylation domain-containing protein